MKSKKMKNKNKTVYFAGIILLIIIIVLILWIISLNQETNNEMAINDYTELPKNSMIIKNEKLGENHLYSFDLYNTYDITKDCSVTATITVGSEILFSKNQSVGKVEAGNSIPISINIGELPQDRCMIQAVPQCKSVS
ncbi:MAG: hypothetical protein KAS15_00425 [Nanoarchaeota archaeon]|nr:hypothetical protein [Nanoarchaeota archaeon]